MVVSKRGSGRGVCCANASRFQHVGGVADEGLAVTSPGSFQHVGGEVGFNVVIIRAMARANPPIHCQARDWRTTGTQLTVYQHLASAHPANEFKTSCKSLSATPSPNYSKLTATPCHLLSRQQIQKLTRNVSTLVLIVTSALHTNVLKTNCTTNSKPAAETPLARPESPAWFQVSTEISIITQKTFGKTVHYGKLRTRCFGLVPGFSGRSVK